MDSPFLSPEFAQAVGRHKPSARVAVLEDGGRVVGFLPFERNRYGIGQAIGYGVSDAQGVVHEVGAHVDWSKLMAHARLSVLEFDHLSAWQAGKAGWNAHVMASPIASLIDYQAYEACRRSSHREHFKSYDKAVRRLTRDVGPLEFEFATDNREWFRQMGRWKSDQYRRSGYPDIWSRPWYRGLVEELRITKTTHLQGIMSSLTVNGTPAALQFSLMSQRTLAGWVTTYDTALSRYSVGIELLRGILRSSDHQPFELYDFGKGDQQYKQVFKTGDIEVAAAWLARPSLVAAMHRAHAAPRERVERFIVSHPALRYRVRSALQGLGKLRAGPRPGKHL